MNARQWELFVALRTAGKIGRVWIDGGGPVWIASPDALPGLERTNAECYTHERFYELLEELSGSRPMSRIGREYLGLPEPELRERKSGGPYVKIA